MSTGPSFLNHMESWDNEEEDSFVQHPDSFRPPFSRRDTSGSSSSSGVVWQSRLDSEQQGSGIGLTLAPRQAVVRDSGGFSDTEELDELDGDGDGFKARAGSTIKFPHPAKVSDFGSYPAESSAGQHCMETIRTVQPKSSRSSLASLVFSEAGLEDSFDLPNSLSNLSLRPLRRQTSKASFLSTPETAMSNYTPSMLHWTETPSSSASITSSASSSQHSPLRSTDFPSTPGPFSPPSLIRSGSEAEPSSDLGEHDLTDPGDEDSLEGILLPDPLFFTRLNSNARLQNLIDLKSGKNLAYPGSIFRRSTQGRGEDTVRIVHPSSEGGPDEDPSFETGLVIEDSLTMGKLSAVRAKARSRTLPLPKGPGVVGKRALKSTSSVGSGVGIVPPQSSRTKDWLKEEDGVTSIKGRKSPLPDQNPSTIGGSSHLPLHPSLERRRSDTPTSITIRISSRSTTVGPISSRSSLKPSRSTTSPSIDTKASLDNSTTHFHSISPTFPPHPCPTLGLGWDHPTSHAQTLLTRKASLPVLSSPTTEERERGLGSRFAAPTASSLARQRDKPDTSSHSYSPSPSSAGGASQPSSPRHHPIGVTVFAPNVVHSRLTLPTSSSRQKVRPALSSTFSQSHLSFPPPTGGLAARKSPPAAWLGPGRSEFVSRLRKKRDYGNGTELDSFDDLRVDREKESRFWAGNEGVGGLGRNIKGMFLFFGRGYDLFGYLLKLVCIHRHRRA